MDRGPLALLRPSPPVGWNKCPDWIEFAPPTSIKNRQLATIGRQFIRRGSRQQLPRPVCHKSRRRSFLIRAKAEEILQDRICIHGRFSHSEVAPHLVPSAVRRCGFSHTTEAQKRRALASL